MKFLHERTQRTLLKILRESHECHNNRTVDTINSLFGGPRLTYMPLHTHTLLLREKTTTTAIKQRKRRDGSQQQE